MDDRFGSMVMRIGAAVGMVAAVTWVLGVPAGPSAFYSLLVYKGILAGAGGLIVVGALARRRARQLATRLGTPYRSATPARLPGGPPR